MDLLQCDKMNLSQKKSILQWGNLYEHHYTTSDKNCLKPTTFNEIKSH